MTAGTNLDRIYRRITARILPPLFCGWVVAYMDNLNVGFAQLQMRTDLGLSDAVFGLGASLALFGAILFQLPSNVLMKRIGARATMTRILLGWVAVSAVMVLIKSPSQYLGLRLLTGVVTAGFWTGILYYLTLWFPDQRRARALSVFLLAPVLAAAAVGPLSGIIIGQTHGQLGLKGWQWMFLLESLPALVFAIWIAARLPDLPEHASFLSSAERDKLLADLSAHHAPPVDPAIRATRAGIGPGIIVLGLINAVASFAIFSVNYFGPSMISDMGGADIQKIGLLAALPYAVGGAAMIAWSRNSDKHGERHFHYLAAVTVAAFGFVLLALGKGLLVGMIGMTLAVAGLLCSVPVFWAIPSALLSSAAAAAGLAVVNMLGDLGGMASPSVIGWFRTFRGEMHEVLLATAAMLLISGFAVFAVRTVPREPK